MTSISLRRLFLLALNAGLASLAAFVMMQPSTIRPGPPPQAIEPPGTAPAAEVEAAAPEPLASDPFAGEEAPPPPPSAPVLSPRQPQPSISLVGTGLGEDSFAALRDGAGTVSRLRKGGTVDGWTLEAVRRNDVVLTDMTTRWRIGFPPDTPMPCENPACVGPP